VPLLAGWHRWFDTTADDAKPDIAEQNDTTHALIFVGKPVDAPSDVFSADSEEEIGLAHRGFRRFSDHPVTDLPNIAFDGADSIAMSSYQYDHGERVNMLEYVVVYDQQIRSIQVFVDSREDAEIPQTLHEFITGWRWKS
jgi:hypothetical protein